MKNTILKAQAYICLIIWMIAACAIDSESMIPFYTCCITGGWLFIFAYANNWFEGRY